MLLQFVGDIEELQNGIAWIAEEAGFEVSNQGRIVEVIKVNDGKLTVSATAETLQITYSRNIHFFRAVGLLVEQLRIKETFEITETPQFTMNGPMFDVSQGGAVMTLDTVKYFVRKMALMGLDMLMMYCEDSFDLAGHPYFGYMRGRYSQAEIKEMDDYTHTFGIELIPCIQTLSHLADVLKWKTYAPISDDHETMLVGEEQTYVFIEEMIKAAIAPVRTKRIHIGMDEAWKLGLGEYLVRNGYHSKFDIMNQHLERVVAITERLGLKPMMWSDMYFRAGSKTGDYYDQDIVISDEVIAGMPKDIQFVYWDYYHFDEAFYEEWIKRHQALGSQPIFAGGIWNWKGYVLNYGATFVSTHAALNVCKRMGITEVIATLWGDDGTECDWHSILLGLQLFAEHGYAEEVDETRLAERFHYCTGAQMADFMLMKDIDEPPGISSGNLELYNPSRYMLWQNVMMGLFDANINGYAMNNHYRSLKEQMAACGERNTEFADMFHVLELLCAVLELKAELGIEIVDAYQNNDRILLQQISTDTLPEVKRRVDQLRAAHFKRWHKLNKAFGWDIIDLRYGGLVASLQTAMDRINSYVDGTIDRLEELEEERLLFQSQEGLVDCYNYKHMPTPSRISQ